MGEHPPPPLSQVPLTISRRKKPLWRVGQDADRGTGPCSMLKKDSSAQLPAASGIRPESMAGVKHGERHQSETGACRRTTVYWEDGPPMLRRKAYGGQANRRPNIRLHRPGFMSSWPGSFRRTVISLVAADSVQCVGPDLAAPSRSLGEGWRPGRANLRRKERPGPPASGDPTSDSIDPASGTARWN